MKKETIGVGAFITKNYADYGRYSALSRTVPGIDGMKPVHRRAIKAISEVLKGSELTSTLNAIGAIQLIHPFGDQTIAETVNSMVRVGALDGKGSFGIKLIEDIPAAAPRYTKIGMSKYKKEYYTSLMDFVPWVNGEEQMEPEYLPIPVPYALVYGSFNWSVGILSRTPAFTFESIVKAYRANDFNLLELQYGYDLIRSQSDLAGLWSTGAGRLTFGMTVDRLDYDTIDIHGSGERLSLNLDRLQPYIDEGRISILPMSKEGVYVRIQKMPRVRNVDMDAIYNDCVSLATKSSMINIQVSHAGQIISLGIKDWLDVTMSIHARALDKYKVKATEDIDFQIDVLKNLPAVGKMVFNGNSDEEIVIELGISKEIVSECLGKTIRTLRKSDHVSKIDSLLSSKESILAITQDNVINKAVEEFNKVQVR